MERNGNTYFFVISRITLNLNLSCNVVQLSLAYKPRVLLSSKIYDVFNIIQKCKRWSSSIETEGWRESDLE